MDEKKEMYVYENLVRHLVGGDMLNEATYLVLDPRWTVKQIKTGGVRHAARDYENVMGALRKRDLKLDAEYKTDQSSVSKALAIIKNAVTLSTSQLLRNEQEVWFQLYGRLIGSNEYDMIREYLEKVRKHAQKPWVRCGDNWFLQQAGGGVKRGWNTNGKVCCACFRGDGSMTAVVQCQNGDGWTCNIWTFEEDDEWKGSIIWSFECEAEIERGVLRKDGNMVILFKKNGVVMILDVGRRMTHSAAQPHNGRIECMQVCENGKVIVFPSDRYTIEIWAVEETRLAFVRSLIHEELMQCAVLSPEGDRVAIGYLDEVVEWCVGSGERRRSFKMSDFVRDVAYSGHGHVAVLSQESIVIFEDDCTGSTRLVTVKTPIYFDEIHFFARGRFLCVRLSYEDWVLDLRDLPHTLGFVKLPELRKVVQCSSDGSEVLSTGKDGRRWDMLEVLNLELLRWRELNTDGERRFDAGAELDEDWEIRMDYVHEAKWNAQGSVIALRNWTWVDLCDAGGKKNTMLRSEQRPPLRAFAWGGELLAVARVDFVSLGAVDLWHTRERRIVGTLRPPKVDMKYFHVTSLAVSKDDSAVVAAANNELFVWFCRDSGWHLAYDVHPYDDIADAIAVSPNATFMTCFVGCDLELYDEHGKERRWVGSALQYPRKVRRLSFDEQNNVLIEWCANALQREQEQWSMWRWRESSEAEPLMRSTPTIGEHRHVYDAQKCLVASFDWKIDDYDYNACANAFVVVADGRHHVLHLET